MKKLLLVTLCVLFLVPALWAADKIEISGTGLDTVDGTYVQDGTADGRPRYVKGDTEIRYREEGKKWLIIADGTPMFRCLSQEETPPLENWQKARGTMQQSVKLPVLKTVSETSGE